MVNKGKWIYNYNSLSPESQLDVAEAIVNELRDNELFLDSSEYDKEKSRLVREFLTTMSLSAQQKEELQGIASIMERFKILTPNNQNKVIDELLAIIAKNLGIQEQEEKEAICEQEGHSFGEWKHNQWTVHIDTVIDHQFVSDFPIKKENWERKCSRCGLVEKVEQEPQELITAREEQNRKKRIKELEGELRQLKKKK